MKTSTGDGGFSRLGGGMKTQNIMSVVGVFPTGHCSLSFSGLGVSAARNTRAGLDRIVISAQLQYKQQTFL